MQLYQKFLSDKMGQGKNEDIHLTVTANKEADDQMAGAMSRISPLRVMRGMEAISGVGL
jgi:hypothetical protein